MSNKVFIILLFLSITISIYINHQVYGNSNSTISNYERIKEFQYEQRKNNSAKVMTDYIYKRIKYYQTANDRYERINMFWDMYQALQNME